MRAWVGKSIVVIGTLHSIFAVVVFHDIFTVMTSERLFNTVQLNSQPNREAAFWFLLTALLSTASHL